MFRVLILGIVAGYSLPVGLGHNAIIQIPLIVIHVGRVSCPAEQETGKAQPRISGMVVFACILVSLNIKVK